MWDIKQTKAYSNNAKQKQKWVTYQLSAEGHLEEPPSPWWHNSDEYFFIALFSLSFLWAITRNEFRFKQWFGRLTMLVVLFHSNDKRQEMCNTKSCLRTIFKSGTGTEESKSKSKVTNNPKEISQNCQQPKKYHHPVYSYCTVWSIIALMILRLRWYILITTLVVPSQLIRIELVEQYFVWILVVRCIGEIFGAWNWLERQISGVMFSHKKEIEQPGMRELQLSRAENPPLQGLPSKVSFVVTAKSEAIGYLCGNSCFFVQSSIRITCTLSLQKQLRNSSCVDWDII